MTNRKLFRAVSAAFLMFALFAVTLTPTAAVAQTSAKAAQVGSFVAPQYAAQLAKIEEKFEKRRGDFGIPGAAMVIVKDGEIIFLKGFGYKDFDKKVPVTPDTQFAIGSATKAFTALSVLMEQEAGKLSLDDNPRKVLSYFKINDPETDKQITIRDLLAHSSGLNRTDIAMVSGKLNREELIRVAGEAKPVSKLRQQFGYQNIMFAAAGEIVAKTSGMTWEKYVAERIFRPLGMTNSNLTVKEMQAAKDYSFGYDFNSDTKETRLLPTRDIGEVSPAGSINSSVRDMANWLKFMMNGGELNGKRLVSEAAFAELVKPQMKIGGKTSYGLGWFLQDWNGMKVVQHGGNIDGFNALVGFVPEKKIGFAILTNVTGSPFPMQTMGDVWENLIGKPETASPAAKPETGNAAPAGDAKELIGRYEFEQQAEAKAEIAEKDGKVMISLPGNQNYEIKPKSKDVFSLAPLPDTYAMKVRRDANGKPNGVIFVQPEGEFTFKRMEASAATATAATDKPKMTVDELMPKVVEALGGEANWRKLNSRVVKLELDLVHQGIKGEATQYAKAPNMTASEMTFLALGKPIGKAFEYFDGKAGGEDTSFTPADKFTGKQLEDSRISSDFYGLLSWKTNYKTATVKGTGKVGDEEAIVVVFEPEKGNKDTIYFSAKTFLPLKVESVITSATNGIELPYSERYEDYRRVDGIMMPFRSISSNQGNGDIIAVVKEVKHNVAVDDKIFQFREF